MQQGCVAGTAGRGIIAAPLITLPACASPRHARCKHGLGHTHAMHP